MRKLTYIITATFILLLFNACQNEMVNPYDLECPPEIWTPKNLKAEQTENGIFISWAQKEEHFDGYRIQVSRDSLEWEMLHPYLLMPHQKTFTDTLNYNGGNIWYRIYGVANLNCSDTCFSNRLEIPFPKAQVVTNSVSDIQFDGASLNGEVLSDGGTSVSERGFCYSTNQDVDINDTKVQRGSGTGSFSETLSGLQPGTTYYVKAYGINLGGTAYGVMVSFTTLATQAYVVTINARNVDANSATLNGEVVQDGGSVVSERGFYYGTSPNVETSGIKIQSGNGLGKFNKGLTGLQPGTIYYFKAYAINGAGIVYGEELMFTTEEEPISCSDLEDFIDDRDGQKYKMVKIGDQVWMAENLAYLPSVSPSSAESYSEPYYYVYNYQGTRVSAAKAADTYDTYGVLYNWPAATNACPSGWHLPSDDEWKQLEMSVGMSRREANAADYRGTNEGEKLKASSGWSNNGNGTNEFCFSALPGGYRGNNGKFNYLGVRCYWWSATSNGGSNAWSRHINDNASDIHRYPNYREFGRSVRCVRD